MIGLHVVIFQGKPIRDRVRQVLKIHRHKHFLTHNRHTQWQTATAAHLTAWRYNHYFEFAGIKDAKNISVKCKLCVGHKALSTSNSSNANLLKNLTKKHEATKLVAKSKTLQ